jgi:uncharacterized protein (TIGR01777 family)
MRRPGTIRIMVLALVLGASRCTTSAFVQCVNLPSKPRASKLSMSFFSDLAANLQRGYSTNASSQFYTVGVTGASGLLGSSLIDELCKQKAVNGKPVRIVKLSRSDNIEPKTLGEERITTLSWNPKATSPEEVVDPVALNEIDALIHLAGENVATGLGPLGFLGIRPWTDEKKAEILDSRVHSTKALAKAIAICKTPTDFMVASGVGVYGDNFIGEGMPPADETMDVSATGGFLAQVSREWEAASKGAGNNRVVNFRMGVILSKKGGALAKLFPIFFLGGGGNVGSGNQYFSFISARDAARALVHTLSTPSIKGPVNICAPNPCTNAEFTSALGKVLGRPTILPFPGFAVSLLFGEMGEEMLLGGVRVVPAKLSQSGFEFEHPTIEEALKSAMDETI